MMSASPKAQTNSYRWTGFFEAEVEVEELRMFALRRTSKTAPPGAAANWTVVLPGFCRVSPCGLQAPGVWPKLQDFS
jgi:hypothetical protein